MNDRPTLAQLVEYFPVNLRPAASDAARQFRDASASDEAIYNMAARAANGEKFVRLWNGDASAVDGNDKSGSSVDQALVNMLAFYSKDPQQVEALWLRSPQGQREKTQSRLKYRHDTIMRAFDRTVPAGNFSAITAQLSEFVDRAKIAANPFSAPVSNEPLPIVFASELASRPIMPPEWLVPDMVIARNVTLFYGDGATGKSLLALMLAYAVAANDRWLGMMVRSGPALFLTAEDEEGEAHRRLAAISRFATPLDQLPNPLAISSLADRDALLAAIDPQTRALRETALYDALRQHVEATRPALVVLDTLADLYGGNENDRGQARWFIGILRRIAITYNTTIVLLAHPSRDGMSTGRGDGGSTAWHNSVRNRLSLTRVEGETNRRILETKKSNYGPMGQKIELEWREGRFAAIGVHTDDAAHRAEAEQSVDDLFLSLLAEFTEREQYLSRTPQSINYAPKMFASNPRARGFTKHQFASAMMRLMSANRIADAKAGPFASKQRDVIVVAGISNSLPTAISG